MKKTKILLSTIIGLLSVGSLATGFTYAWLSNATTIVDFDHAGGGIISSYFHCGTGTKEDPYVITRPVHLFNLVELMYADVEHFQVYDKYFQLGYDLDGNDQDLEFYDYDNNGVLQINTSTGEPKTTKVLNMAYYSGDRALLPIGQYDDTKNYPFAGQFDGSGLTVANLEVKGDGTTGIDDLGFFGYVTEDAFIHDFYIDNITINASTLTTGIHNATATAHTANANVGYIAGHIQNAYSFENVYVNNSKITGTSTVLVHNDWGYYGKCDNAGTLEDFIGRAGAEDPSWGGSVNMQKMYNRLYDIAGDATRNNNYVYEKDVVTRVDGTTFSRDRTTARAYTYRDREEGSFVFSSYGNGNNDSAAGQYLYISGGTRDYPYREVETTSNNGFSIRSGSGTNARYLGIQNGAIANVQTGWYIDDSDKLATYINGVVYYLNHNCQVVTSTTDTWTKSRNTISYSSGWNTYYLTYRNNTWQAYNPGWFGEAPTLTLNAATVTKITETSNGSTYMNYTGTNVTYFPLITEDGSYAAGEKNTGYVMGGSQDKTTSATYPYKTGDIRVSRYTTSNISASYSDDELTNVYTINSNGQTVKINTNDYEKYLDSKTGFLESITNGNIYGLHFMSASISADHLVTADYALINGEEKTNYKMPASSIDFNLTDKGYINFFAGTYFTNNNSFFSLHHIVRDENDQILSIREITDIYKSTSDRKPYVYKYGDGTYSGSLTSDYSLAFSTSRIKKQSSITKNAVYYFEIPVNEGEYALGSVDGGTGAYLMYLDIGTNGGINYDTNVDTFGKVDFRSSPDVLGTDSQGKELNTMLLITYQQPANTAVDLTVVYTKATNRYDITCKGTIGTITITVLSVDIVVYYNGAQLPQLIKANEKTVPTS